MGSNRLRDIIFNRINQHMIDKDFYVVNSDFIGRSLIEIKTKYPERFIQVGIAEQNMISIACGLALEGKRPITFSPNPFEYLRSYDQVRNGICVMHLPVVIIANGMGFVNPGLGITHITTEDYQLFSLCPGMRIITVSDETIASATADYIISGIDSPVYIRIDFDNDGEMPFLEDVDFDKGFRYVKWGEGVLVITQGYAVKTALVGGDRINASVIDVFGRPFDFESLFVEMNNYKKVIVLEEQQRRGGLGSELLELCNQHRKKIDVEILAVDYGDRFPDFFGSREFWMDAYGVGCNALLSRINGFGGCWDENS